MPIADSAIKDQKNQNCDKRSFPHETLIRIGITCKKIPCYMCDSAGHILSKVLKYFEVMLNIIEFSYA